MTEATSTELVYEFLVAYTHKAGHPPSQREIAKGCYLAQSSVRYHLHKLVQQGRITYAQGKPRSIVVKRPPADLGEQPSP